MEPRDDSRLLVLDRASGRIEHSVFHRLGEYLKAGDLLTLNDTRVIRGRLRAKRKGTGGRVEFLLLRRLSAGVWQGVGRPGRRLHPGERYEVDAADVEVEVREKGEDGTLTLGLSTEAGMEGWGEMPLPPYIRQSLGGPGTVPDGVRKGPGKRSGADGWSALYQRSHGSVGVARGGASVPDAPRGLGYLPSRHGRRPSAASDP